MIGTTPELLREAQDVCCSTAPSWQGGRCAPPLHPPAEAGPSIDCREMLGQIDTVAQKANNQNETIFNAIDDVMLGVVVDTHRRIVLEPFCRETGIVGNNLDRVPPALLIPIRLRVAEIHDPVEITVDDVGLGLLRESNFHPAATLLRVSVPLP